jgi:hypothetical protein
MGKRRKRPGKWAEREAHLRDALQRMKNEG